MTEIGVQAFASKVRSSQAQLPQKEFVNMGTDAEERSEEPVKVDAVDTFEMACQYSEQVHSEDLMQSED